MHLSSHLILLLVATLGLTNCNNNPEPSTTASTNLEVPKEDKIQEDKVKQQPEVKKSKEELQWPDTSGWVQKKFKNVQLLAPADLIITEESGIILELYPGIFYTIKSEYMIPDRMKMNQYRGTEDEFRKDPRYKEFVDLDMVAQKKYIQEKRTEITWHLDDSEYAYFEALDYGSKTFSCYGRKKIEGKNFWFDFDGLYYEGNHVTRLTEQDCLMAIAIFKSMQALK